MTDETELLTEAKKSNVKRGGDETGLKDELREVCSREVEERAKASSSSLRGAGCGAFIMHSALFLTKTTNPSENIALSAYFST